MARRRDPSPFGSRLPDRSDLPLWLLRDVGNLETRENRVGRGRLKPEFFQMIAAHRATRTRLVVEAAALVAGAALFFVLPLGALLIVVAVTVAGVLDLVILARLRRRIDEAWQDLAIESP